MTYHPPNIEALKRGRIKLQTDLTQPYRLERLKALEDELRMHGALADDPHENLHREKTHIAGKMHRLKKRLRQLERRSKIRRRMTRSEGGQIFKTLFGA
jgi:hypothetical protein